MPEPQSQNTDEPFNLIPLDKAPGLILRMIGRFAEGLPEPMVIGANDKPVAALIPIADLLRLREYDRRVLDSEDLFYSELDRRLNDSDTTIATTDLDAFARTLGDIGTDWADNHNRSERN